MGSMTTYSGRLIEYANPNPDNIVIEDIAWHLARINRFNGATRYGYSVAAHSVMVSRRVPAGHAVLGLLHDAQEAYLNDLNPGLKEICPEYRVLESRFWAIIAKKFNLPEEIPTEVKEIDRKVAAWESQILQPWPPAWAQLVPLPEPDFTIPIYNECHAEQHFLARYHALTGGDNG